MAFLELSRCALYYTIDGAGPPLLLIHGGSCDHADWHHQVAALEAEFTVVTVDLRGHGASVAEPADCTIEQYAADVHALLGATGLGSAVLVGHSLGTRVALQVAAEHPEQVSGVVLIDGSLQARGTSAAVDAAHAARFGDSARVLDLLRPQFEGMFFANADPAERARIMARFESQSGELVLIRSRATLGWDAARLDATLAALGVPALAIQSTYTDPSGVRRQLRAGDTTPYLDRLRTHLPGVEIELVTGAGHFVMLEEPDVVTESIRRFASAVVRPTARPPVS